MGATWGALPLPKIDHKAEAGGREEGSVGRVNLAGGDSIRIGSCLLPPWLLTGVEGRVVIGVDDEAVEEAVSSEGPGSEEL